MFLVSVNRLALINRQQIFSSQLSFVERRVDALRKTFFSAISPSELGL